MMIYSAKFRERNIQYRISWKAHGASNE